MQLPTRLPQAPGMGGSTPRRARWLHLMCRFRSTSHLLTVSLGEFLCLLYSVVSFRLGISSYEESIASVVVALRDLLPSHVVRLGIAFCYVSSACIAAGSLFVAAAALFACALISLFSLLIADELAEEQADPTFRLDRQAQRADERKAAAEIDSESPAAESSSTCRLFVCFCWSFCFCLSFCLCFCSCVSVFVSLYFCWSLTFLLCICCEVAFSCVRKDSRVCAVTVLLLSNVAILCASLSVGSSVASSWCLPSAIRRACVGWFYDTRLSACRERGYCARGVAVALSCCCHCYRRFARCWC
jgi:hypothetical protein